MTDSWLRQKGVTVFPVQDAELMKREIERIGAKTVLEFGPGESTEFLLSLGMKVTTCEYIDKWFDVAKEKFGKRVRLLKFDDDVPVVVHGLGENEKFDIAFVDAPKGYTNGRKVHKGFEDCSRINTCLFALQRAPVVLLHDTCRPLEKGTLGRLNGMGYEFTQLKSLWGLARITHDRNKSRPHQPNATQSGGSPARPVRKRRGIPVGLRPD